MNANRDKSDPTKEEMPEKSPPVKLTLNAIPRDILGRTRGFYARELVAGRGMTEGMYDLASIVSKALDDYLTATETAFNKGNSWGYVKSLPRGSRRPHPRRADQVGREEQDTEKLTITRVDDALAGRARAYMAKHVMLTETLTDGVYDMSTLVAAALEKLLGRVEKKYNGGNQYAPPPNHPSPHRKPSASPKDVPSG